MTESSSDDSEIAEQVANAPKEEAEGFMGQAVEDGDDSGGDGGSLFGGFGLPDTSNVKKAALSTETGPAVGDIQEQLGVSKPTARIIRAAVRAAKAVDVPDVSDAVGDSDGEVPAAVELAQGVYERNFKGGGEQ